MMFYQYIILQDTCTGFLLGGIGELNSKRHPNFLVVNKGMAQIPQYRREERERECLHTLCKWSWILESLFILCSSDVFHCVAVNDE